MGQGSMARLLADDVVYTYNYVHIVLHDSAMCTYL